jgi:hypothetical protein
MSKTLITICFVIAGAFAAAAQTSPPGGSPNPPGMSGPGGSNSEAVSAATHCRDTTGRVRLKTDAMAGPGSGTTSSTTGSATTTTPPSASAPSSPTASTLPNC